MKIENKFFDKKDPELLLEEYKKLIRRHILARKSQDYYAEKLKISKTKLSKITKQYLGQSPFELIREILATEIIYSLINTEKPIKELSYYYGFSSSASLSRFMKEATGLTPSKFRALNCLDK